MKSALYVVAFSLAASISAQAQSTPQLQQAATSAFERAESLRAPRMQLVQSGFTRLTSQTSLGRYTNSPDGRIQEFILVEVWGRGYNGMYISRLITARVAFETSDAVAPRLLAPPVRSELVDQP